MLIFNCQKMLWISIIFLFSTNAAQAEVTFVQQVAGPNGLKDEEGYATGSWQVKCQKDNFTDQKFCSISAQAARHRYHQLHFILTEDKKLSAGILIADEVRFPDSRKTIRVDTNPAISVSGADLFELSGSHRELLDQLIAGTRVRTRWQNKSHKDSPIDDEFSLIGFREALSVAKAFAANGFAHPQKYLDMIVASSSGIMGADYVRLKACKERVTAKRLMRGIRRVFAPYPTLAKDFEVGFELSVDMADLPEPVDPKECEAAEKRMRDQIKSMPAMLSVTVK